LALICWQQSKKQVLAQMQTDARGTRRWNRLHEHSGTVIGRVCTVRGARGTGRPDKVHANAPAHELRKARLAAARQQSATVIYDRTVIGAYLVDLLAEDAVPVELKTAKALDDTHRGQCVNSRKATGLHHCLLRNFGRHALKQAAWCTASAPLHTAPSA